MGGSLFCSFLFSWLKFDHPPPGTDTLAKVSFIFRKLGEFAPPFFSLRTGTVQHFSKLYVCSISPNSTGTFTDFCSSVVEAAIGVSFLSENTPLRI